MGDSARPIEPTGGTGGGSICAEGQTSCSGSCVDVQTNREHCGACGAPCAPADVCSLGQCGSECMGGLERCGDQCIDTMIDVAHCGACDAPCTGPSAHGQPACTAGQCGIDCDDDALASADECLGCAAATIIEAAPVAYWRLGEATGTSAIDASGNGAHGVYVSIGLGAPGVASDNDTAAVLGSPSASRMVRTDFASFPTSAITVELWMRSSDTASAGTAVSYAAGGVENGFIIFDYRNVEVFVRNQSALSGVSLNDGMWHHVALTWESATGAVQLFVDGAAAFTTTLAQGLLLPAGGALVLGQEQDCVGGCFDGGQRFIGELDEVAVFDRVLSAAELAVHAQTVTCTL